MEQKIDEKFMSEMVNRVRTAIYDYEKVNRLIKDKQFSDPIIKEAIVKAINKIIQTPPIINMGYKEIPVDFLIKGAVINLLETAMIVDTRNSIQYQDAGLQVQDTHEAQWGQMINAFYQIFMNELKQWKTSMNIEKSLSGIKQTRWFY